MEAKTKNIEAEIPEGRHAEALAFAFEKMETIESKGHIQVTTSQRHGTILVNISINGQCIEEEHQVGPKRPLSAIQKENNGKELGMRAIYDVIQVHKGRMDILNRSEERTYFSIILPYDNGL